MSKSILVIDTPENCNECPLFLNVYTDMTCRGNGRTIDYPFPDDKIQDWCPLRDFPRKKMLIGLDGASNALEMRERGRQQGFNDCIDEILKGEKQ